MEVEMIEGEINIERDNEMIIIKDEKVDRK